MGEPKGTLSEHSTSRLGEPGSCALVVEADARAREWMQTTLQGDYTLRFAGGVQDALNAVREAQPQVVVSEVDLADDGDGFELCRRIRQLTDLRELPILLLSRRGGTADKVRGFQSGADDYVVRPVDGWVLRARLRLLQRIKSIEPPALLGEHL